jgi:PPOX class probable F420-dependent enzyme
MSSSLVPERFLPLLEEPNFGYLGTVRDDGAVQVNPMWFLFDGKGVRFTHTTARRKFRNLQLNPSMSLTVSDPANPYSYVELRGRLAEVIADPDGSFYMQLQKRYGQSDPRPPADAADRVVHIMTVDHVSGQ